MVILSDQHFSHFAGAMITERDLQVLERFNHDNILSLEGIVANIVHTRKYCKIPAKKKDIEQIIS